MNSGAFEDVLPGGLRTPSSVFISGTSRPLLKWVALALLAPSSSRVYWTCVRLAGEELEPLDPMTLGVVPDERIHILQPHDLQPEDQEARRAESAAGQMLRSDEEADSVQRIFDFLRLPSHTQERLSTTFRDQEPAILIAANAHRLVGLYTSDSIGPVIRSIVGSGACLVALWADAPPKLRSVFDLVLRVEGNGPASWRDATLTCEKGIDTGPLAGGTPVRLAELPTVASVLERSLPSASQHWAVP